MGSINFYNPRSEAAAAKLVADAVEQASSSGRSVLVLLSGGSAIGTAVRLSGLIDSVASKCTFSLVDERWGRPGHADSNWQQLKSADLRLDKINFYEVLNGQDATAAAGDFNAFLQQALNDHDYIIGLFGIGADGHTAGILPGSPAVAAKGYAVAYSADDYQRITITPLMIAKIDEAFVYALGPAKAEQLDRLALELPLDKQPAQALKTVPKLVIFNDSRGVKL